MPRFLAGVGSTLLLVLAGFFAWKSIAQRETPELPAPPPAARRPPPAARRPPRVRSARCDCAETPRGED